MQLCNSRVACFSCPHSLIKPSREDNYASVQLITLCCDVDHDTGACGQEQTTTLGAAHSCWLLPPCQRTGQNCAPRRAHCPNLVHIEQHSTDVLHAAQTSCKHKAKGADQLQAHCQPTINGHNSYSIAPASLRLVLFQTTRENCCQALSTALACMMCMHAGLEVPGIQTEPPLYTIQYRCLHLQTCPCPSSHQTLQPQIHTCISP